MDYDGGDYSDYHDDDELSDCDGDETHEIIEGEDKMEHLISKEYRGPDDFTANKED